VEKIRTLSSGYALDVLAVPIKRTTPDLVKIKNLTAVVCLGRIFRKTEEPHLFKPPVLSYLRFEIILEVREVN